MGKSIIIYVTGFMTIFALQLRNMGDTGNYAAMNLYSGYENIMAGNIANSGAEYALAKITQLGSWYDGLDNQAFADGTVNVTVTDRPDMGSGVLEIASYAAYGNAFDSTRVFLTAQIISDRFSRFSYFSNTEPVIWFYSQDTLFGPVHTNGQFHMTGTPVFYGLVSSVSSDYAENGYTAPRFFGGTDFGRNPIELNPDFTELQQAAFGDGHLYQGSTLYIEFTGDTTYRYRTGYFGSWNTRDLPDNGVIACDRDIYVEGTLDGQVTIVSWDDIFITDDILYADDPETNPESEDVLGLVAYDDVIVKDNSANRGGCTIQAAILAKDGSFKAENIYFSPSGRLELYGGIVQERRGAVGALGSPPTGFEKYYKYDERMELIYPPYYPVASGSLDNLDRKAYVKIISWIE